jgi:diketogulonate reductase-like aldo/keto reductase
LAQLLVAVGGQQFVPAGREALIKGRDDGQPVGQPACETKPMVNQIRWFIGLDPSDTVQRCAEHDIVVEATSTEHIMQNAELDFEIADADMRALGAMRDTEQHEDAKKVRWS